jgi:hypothetical protein
MNTYPQTFYDLLSAGLGANGNRELQGFLDDILARKYNELNLAGFPFASDMLIDFTYEQVRKELKMNVMATYVDIDSPAIPIGTEGAQLQTGKIPRMKMVEYLNEDKIRKQIILEQRFGATSNRAKQAALRSLFVTTDNLVGAHTNSLTYQRHQIVSTGQFALTNTNNPRGIKDVFAAHIPTDNVETKTGNDRWWTALSNGVYSTEGNSCDPIQDLKDMVDTLEGKGVSAMHFEIDKLYAKQVINHSVIKSAIGYYLNPESTAPATLAGNLTFERKFEILGDLVGAPFVIQDSIVAVESFNKTTKELERSQIRSFEANVIVLVPDGNLGETLTVEPIALEGGTYASMFGGRLLMTVGYDYIKKIQSFNTEMTSLVVPDKPHLMFYLHPYAKA